MTALPPRQDRWIPSQNGKAELAAWFYPSPSGKRGPAVVLGHGLGATRVMGLDRYAETFQKAGYSAIAFDYAGFGASRGTLPRQVLEFYRQQDDWEAVIAYVRGLDIVDPESVALFGTSFGGGHAIYRAAKDKRIAAAIAQCPFTDGFSSSLTLGVLPTLLMLPLALSDFFLSFFTNLAIPVPIAATAGSVALMNAHDVYDGCWALIPKGAEVTKTVAARAALQIPFLYPGKKAKEVKCNLYVAVCMTDTVAPPGPTLKYAKQAPKGTVKEYECGHFDIYQGHWYEEATAEYVAFLKRSVPPVLKR